MRSHFATLLICLLFVPFANADIYRWVDSNGKVHYTDTPPPKEQKNSKKVEIKINSISGPAVVSKVEGITNKRVRVFTATWCGYCRLAKAHLAKRGVAYEEIDIEATEAGQREYQSLGGRGVPIILVGSQRMDGFDANGIDNMLANLGK